MSDSSHSTLRGLSRGKSPSRIVALRQNKDYLLGIGLLLVVVFLWTSSAFVTQGLFDGGYEKPFLITYLCTSSFALYLVPYVIRNIYRRGGVTQDASSSTREGYQPLGTEAAVNEILTPPSPDTIRDPSGRTAEDDLARLTVRETAHLAAWFCLLWFIANWSQNASLGYTSVASATILSSMSGFFTLAIGRVFRVETLTIIKIAAVVTSFGGVMLVSFSDSSQEDLPATIVARAPIVQAFSKSFNAKHVIGDSLALISALFYAFYVTLLKVQIRSESRIDMQLFFGFVGLFNIVLTWPIGVVLHYTGVERFELPTTTNSTIGVLVNMAITLSSDFIYVIAMLKTTPLVVTIGLSLTMPLAVVGDFILKKPTKLQVILGATVVLMSFVAVGLEDSKNQEEEDLISGRRLDEEGNATVRLSEDVHLGSREPGS
ncbi:hypothetical protein BXZ70DRAFT_928732 [Cristinia sonorae]|uniref:EamA domain-containing protein n=1 Tax=Cristinia sonorae TaxID=1940300 RepID=A0A8K0UTU2_9AGAR|nr:hypothetical protein BXZ70DRAFT_928732 [Cristinia sonorae]